MDAIYNKLEIYWNRHLADSSSVSALLDPRYKATTFNNNSTEYNDCIDHLKSLFSSYTTNSHIIPNRTNEQNSRNYFLNIINRQAYSPAENVKYDEINTYLNTSNDINADPLLWWKDHQNEYPTLSLIAKDYLCIQATSVASEQAFSVAGNTITPTRNKLDPMTTRATLCLKSWIENKMGISINHETSGGNDDNNSDGNDDVYSDSSDGSYSESINRSDTDNSSGLVGWLGWELGHPLRKFSIHIATNAN